jgi:adenosylcobinamide kinase/adenosylcobinamide-phosphate guanylyltransferase
MTARIIHHQRERLDDGWQTLVAPSTDTAILVDCLTLWLSNWLMKEDLSHWHNMRDLFYGVFDRAALILY